jgi:hypothetical protein
MALVRGSLGSTLPVLRRRMCGIDRVQFPASRQCHCPTVRGTVAVPEEM